MTSLTCAQLDYYENVLGVSTYLQAKSMLNTKPSEGLVEEVSLVNNISSSEVNAQQSVKSTLSPVQTTQVNLELSEKFDFLFIIPSNLSKEAKALLHKIEFAVAPFIVKVSQDLEEVERIIGDGSQALIFGDQTFAKLGYAEETFFEHLSQPIHKNGIGFFASHDLEDMVGSGSQVAVLKKQVWTQLKTLRKTLRS